MHNFFFEVLHDIEVLFTFLHHIYGLKMTLEVISDLNVQGANFGGKRTNLAEYLSKS